MPGALNLGGGDQARDGLEPCPRDEAVQRLRESAKMIADFAVQDERPTLTGFGINLLHSSVARAIERIEADQSSLDTMAGRIEDDAETIARLREALEYARQGFESVQRMFEADTGFTSTLVERNIWHIDAALRGEQP